MSTPKIRKYDPNSIKEIRKEYGVNETEAIKIASTTMDGADTTPEGYINSTQTICDELNYNERLPASKGQKDGQKITTTALKQFMEEKGIKPKKGEDPADAWIRLNTGPETSIKKRW